ncbi:MAG: hypothetical protein J0I12_30220 [Candidatus Eremiobacteraeota bacterium]|nr:hypothetical protein [Candidatus Eremiobacteraeota bacterium]
MKDHIHAQIQSATEPDQVRKMLREMEKARPATRCAATCHQHHGQVHGLYRQLTRQRMHEVQEPSLADVIRRLFS